MRTMEEKLKYDYEWRARNPDKVKATRQRWYERNRDKVLDNVKHGSRKRKYGLSKETYQEMLEIQDGKCAICKIEKKLCVDHDHATGKVRGLLCGVCNLSIGGFKDDIELLNKAILYLERYDQASR